MSRRLSIVDAKTKSINGEALAVPYVCRRFGIGEAFLYDRKRTPGRTEARRAITWLVSEYSGASSGQLEHLLGFSHSTIQIFLRDFATLMKQDHELRSWARFVLEAMRAGELCRGAA